MFAHAATAASELVDRSVSLSDEKREAGAGQRGGRSEARTRIALRDVAQRLRSSNQARGVTRGRGDLGLGFVQRRKPQVPERRSFLRRGLDGVLDRASQQIGGGH